MPLIDWTRHGPKSAGHTLLHTRKVTRGKDGACSIGGDVAPGTICRTICRHIIQGARQGMHAALVSPNSRGAIGGPPLTPTPLQVAGTALLHTSSATGRCTLVGCARASDCKSGNASWLLTHRAPDTSSSAQSSNPPIRAAQDAATQAWRKLQNCWKASGVWAAACWRARRSALYCGCCYPASGAAACIAAPHLTPPRASSLVQKTVEVATCTLV